MPRRTARDAGSLSHPGNRCSEQHTEEELKLHGAGVEVQRAVARDERDVPGEGQRDEHRRECAQARKARCQHDGEEDVERHLEDEGPSDREDSAVGTCWRASGEEEIGPSTCHQRPSPLSASAGAASNASTLAVVTSQYIGTMRSMRRAKKVRAGCEEVSSGVVEIIMTKPLMTKKMSTPVTPLSQMLKCRLSRREAMWWRDEARPSRRRRRGAPE